MLSLGIMHKQFRSSFGINCGMPVEESDFVELNDIFSNIFGMIVSTMWNTWDVVTSMSLVHNDIRIAILYSVFSFIFFL